MATLIRNTKCLNKSKNQIKNPSGLVLGIETGTQICSVSLSRGDELLALRESDKGLNHASKLGLYIDEILREAGYSPDELNAVAVSKGPGSYTGLRIGVSTAKGLCYALGIPLIAIGSLRSLAKVMLQDYQAGVLPIEDLTDTLLCPMIDARRMEVYAQVFDTELGELTEVGAHIIDQGSFGELINRAKNFVIFGDGAAKCLDILPEQGVQYVEVDASARGLVEPAWEALQEGRFEDIAYFEPLYLKDFVITKSKKQLL